MTRLGGQEIQMSHQFTVDERAETDSRLSRKLNSTAPNLLSFMPAVSDKGEEFERMQTFLGHYIHANLPAGSALTFAIVCRALVAGIDSHAWAYRMPFNAAASTEFEAIRLEAARHLPLDDLAEADALSATLDKINRQDAAELAAAKPKAAHVPTEAELDDALIYEYRTGDHKALRARLKVDKKLDGRFNRLIAEKRIS